MEWLKLIGELIPKLLNKTVLPGAVIALVLCIILLLVPQLLPHDLSKIRPWLPLATVVSLVVFLVTATLRLSPIFVRRRAAVRTMEATEKERARTIETCDEVLERLNPYGKLILRKFPAEQSRSIFIPHSTVELNPEIDSGIRSLLSFHIIQESHWGIDGATYVIDELVWDRISNKPALIARNRADIARK